MIAPLVMGVVAGSRSVTPLAAVSLLARARRLSGRRPPVRLLASRWVFAGAIALPVAELLGDKMRSVPDRTVPPGMLARLLMTGGIAEAALADDKKAGAVVGAAVVVASSYFTIAVRKRCIARYGQWQTGVVKDSLVVALAIWIVSRAGMARSRP